MALSTTKWQAIRTNVLPYAIPGMLTGTILGLARAAGEMASILFTGAAFYLPFVPKSLFSQFMALPYHLYIMSTQHHATAKVRPIVYGTALVLIILVFTMNLSAILLRYRLRKIKREYKINKIKIKVNSFSFYYNGTKTLKDLSMDIVEHRIIGIIGPSSCSKSTFLRSLNRMNDLILGSYAEGEILIDNQNIYAMDVDVVSLRRKIGMVFQKSNPFPKSIFDNVSYGLRVNGIKDKNLLAEKVEKSPKDAALWNEVKDRLKESAFALSGSHQQRLCIARALAIEPEVILIKKQIFVM